MKHESWNIQYSIFNIQYSKFKIQYSIFNIQYSKFNIQYSKFNIQHSKFKIRCHYSQLCFTHLKTKFEYWILTPASLSNAKFNILFIPLPVHSFAMCQKYSQIKLSAKQLFKFLSELWSVFPWEFKVKRKPKFNLI